ncbi:MAG: histidine--tRNA ligase [Candidatus Omnitrophica bacterium]|nr:histidine--tRNA ligase [Candidatus Omnitrophota bacterium]
MKYKSLRGMPDILAEEASVRHKLEDAAREVFRVFGFGEISTPVLEETKVFTRSIGEDTDIVEKEMYSFSDRGGKTVSLRPEGTASIIRAYIEHAELNSKDICKLFYVGPMFRAERPQKGRLRQFHQIGAEIISLSSPFVDAELILNLKILLSKIGLKDFTIFLNSLGCSADRTKYKKVLKKYLSKKNAEICDNCKKRSEVNVLRVLDCKNKKCAGVIKLAPKISDFLCRKCKSDQDALKKTLKEIGVKFTEKDDLVRGLDYYTGTVFEVMHSSLGAQDAIAAGGRYNGLIKEMGGEDMGATGYAVGIERVLLLLSKETREVKCPDAIILPMDEDCRPEAMRIAGKFWLKGIPCEVDHTARSFKGRLRRAHKEGRGIVIIIGENEIKNKRLTLKKMKTGEQVEVSFEQAVEIVGTDPSVSP